jgi:hypothetical protein
LIGDPLIAHEGLQQIRLQHEREIEGPVGSGTLLMTRICQRLDPESSLTDEQVLMLGSRFMAAALEIERGH